MSIWVRGTWRVNDPAGAVYRAGVIGRTGRGDYGHDLDLAFEGFPNVRLVTVADTNPEGLRAAGKRTGAQRLYADYREMLERESLDLAVVCPTWLDCHAEMVIACAESGVKGVLCEKPLARTLVEADSMIEACERNGVRLAVAHRRGNRHEQNAKRLVEEGVIGQVQVIQGHGKADWRAGAMDLMILGTHIMDSMRYFAGSDVSWAQGHVTQDGRPVTTDDIREGDVGVGPLAGNGVTASYVFENGITAHFESYLGQVARDRNNRWNGFEVYGTEGIMSLRNSSKGEVYLYPHRLWHPEDRGGEWERITPPVETLSGAGGTEPKHWLVVSELIEAIEGGREVAACSSGRDGRAALEMIMAVHESHRLKARVSFPLQNRENPYKTWLEEEGRRRETAPRSSR